MTSEESDWWCCLAPPQVFPPAVFLPDDQNPRDVCAFVLALATIYDDFKDLIMADGLLETRRPAGRPARTAEWGQFNGFRAYLVRILAGLFHELFCLVHRDRAVLQKKAFAETIALMHPDALVSWEAIWAAALGGPKGRKLAQTLVRIRNTLAFHYDSDEILRGYEAATEGSSEESAPWVSLGSRMRETKFYFADSAAQARFQERLRVAGFGDEFGPRSTLIPQVNDALWDVIISFVRRRGNCWKLLTEN